MKEIPISIVALKFIFSQASGTCKLQQQGLWEFLSFRPCNTAAMAQKFECGEAFTVSE